MNLERIFEIAADCAHHDYDETKRIKAVIVKALREYSQMPVTEEMRDAGYFTLDFGNIFNQMESVKLKQVLGDE